MVEDMRPHATTIRAGRAAGAIVLTVATLVLLVTLHPLISIPVIVGIAAGVCGNQHRTRRRRARIEKQRQRPYKLPRSDR